MGGTGGGVVGIGPETAEGVGMGGAATVEGGGTVETSSLEGVTTKAVVSVGEPKQINYYQLLYMYNNAVHVVQ